MERATEKNDVLKEVINIGVGRGTDVLNKMVGSNVRLQVICLKTLPLSELEDEIRAGHEGRFSCVHLPFTGDFSGVVELVFPMDSALRFVSALTQDRINTADMDSIHAGALCEVGNIVLNTVMGTVSNHFGVKFVYSVPIYRGGDFTCMMPSHISMQNAAVLFARVNFNIESIEVAGDIVLFFEIDSFNRLLEAIEVYDKAMKS